jgi:hypothetical protein
MPPRFCTRASATALLVVGVVLLGAALPAGGGLTYDIHFTVTTVKAGTGQSTRAFDEGLAHAQLSGTKARIDVTKGPIGAVPDGDFLIIRDTSTFLFSPSQQQYAQIDPAKMLQGLSGVVGALNTLSGVQATNVKVDESALGAGDHLGAYSTLKYRITEDYTVSLNLMGMVGGSSMTGHTTTDYWYPQAAPALVNPFVAKGASPTQLPVNLGPAYASQMSAARGKLPAGVPVKIVVTTVVSDANGNRTTTTTLWELTNITPATIADAVFETPAGYTQLTAGDALMAVAGGGASGAAPETTAAHPGGTPASGVAGAATGAANGVGNAAKQGVVSGVNGTISGAANDAASGAVKKILHIP